MLRAMRTSIASLLALSLFACGGGDKKESTTPVAVKPAEPVKTKPVEPPPPPPPPKEFSAKAALTAVKGVKLTPVTVSFSQKEGGPTSVKAEIEGLKAGKYHFIIHEAGECGPNATKAGAPWAGGSSVALGFTVLKGAIGEVDESVALPIDGDTSIVGHTLVLHDDKKGAPGKPVACGTIDKADDATAAAAPAE